MKQGFPSRTACSMVFSVPPLRSGAGKARTMSARSTSCRLRAWYAFTAAKRELIPARSGRTVSTARPEARQTVLTSVSIPGAPPWRMRQEPGKMERHCLIRAVSDRRRLPVNATIIHKPFAPQRNNNIGRTVRTIIYTFAALHPVTEGQA